MACSEAHPQAAPNADVIEIGGLVMQRTLTLLLPAAVLITAGPLFAQNIPQIAYDSAPNFLKLPDGLYLGEAVGVATNSKGHVFVYTRTGSPQVSMGTNRAFVRNAARLFQFDQTGKYVREIGQGLYGFVFAHAVRIDRQDNIWVIDEGSNMVIKFHPEERSNMVIKFDLEARLLMTLGRKPEAINVPAPAASAAGERGAGAGERGGAGARGGAGGRGGGPAGAGVPGDNFNRPTDVAWD